jgi:hypothetical protein
MLVYGASRREALEMAMHRWRLSRRSAEDYLRRSQDRLAGDALTHDRLFYLKISQMQRDKLVGLALRYAHENRERLDPRILQSLAAITTAVRGLLDSRDRAAAEIQLLVVQGVEKATVLVAEHAQTEPKGERCRNGSAAPTDPALNGDAGNPPAPTPPSQTADRQNARDEEFARKLESALELDDYDALRDAILDRCAGCADGLGESGTHARADAAMVSV